MKNKTRFASFLLGAAAALALGSVTLPALAASGAFTISADPINVMVNGEVFRPKDANGEDALVFAYNGTTYAPSVPWPRLTAWRSATTASATWR